MRNVTDGLVGDRHVLDSGEEARKHNLCEHFAQHCAAQHRPHKAVPRLSAARRVTFMHWTAQLTHACSFAHSCVMCVVMVSELRSP